MKPQKTLQDLDYDIEIDRIAKEIKKQKAKRVLIQLPDGLKPFATIIAEAIKQKTKNKAEVLIYFGSCFGACDVPIDEAKSAGIDLIIQFGHSAWKFGKKK